MENRRPPRIGMLESSCVSNFSHSHTHISHVKYRISHIWGREFEGSDSLENLDKTKVRMLLTILTILTYLLYYTILYYIILYHTLLSYFSYLICSISYRISHICSKSFISYRKWSWGRLIHLPDPRPA